MKTRNSVFKTEGSASRTVAWFGSKGVSSSCKSIVIDFMIDNEDRTAYEYSLQSVNSSNTSFADADGRTATIADNVLSLKVFLDAQLETSRTYHFGIVDGTISTSDEIVASTLDIVKQTGTFLIFYGKDAQDSYSEDANAVVQYMIQHLSIMKNELWYDFQYGLPLLSKGVTKAMIDSEAISIIYSNPDVAELESFSSVISNVNGSMNYSASFSVITIYGKQQIDT